MPQALSAHAVVLLNDGTAMVCGGKNNAGRAQSACYSYNATADEWTSTSSMNTARYGHGMSVHGYRNGSLPQHSHMHTFTDDCYVYGGKDENHARLASIEWRDLSYTDAPWSTDASRLHTADAHFASVNL
jgi:hypothetical protein